MKVQQGTPKALNQNIILMGLCFWLLLLFCKRWQHTKRLAQASSAPNPRYRRVTMSEAPRKGKEKGGSQGPPANNAAQGQGQTPKAEPKSEGRKIRQRGSGVGTGDADDPVTLPSTGGSANPVEILSSSSPAPAGKRQKTDKDSIGKTNLEGKFDAAAAGGASGYSTSRPKEKKEKKLKKEKKEEKKKEEKKKKDKNKNKDKDKDKNKNKKKSKGRAHAHAPTTVYEVANDNPVAGQSFADWPRSAVILGIVGRIINLAFKFGCEAQSCQKAGRDQRGFELYSSDSYDNTEFSQWVINLRRTMLDIVPQGNYPSTVTGNGEAAKQIRRTHIEAIFEQLKPAATFALTEHGGYLDSNQFNNVNIIVNNFNGGQASSSSSSSTSSSSSSS